MKKRGFRWLFLGLALAVGILAAPRIQRGYEALLFLADLAGYEIPIIMESRPQVSRQALEFTQATYHYQADLYRSTEPPKAGLLLIHGAVADGKDNPRLQHFAISLARSRFAVLVPNIPSLRNLKLTPDTTHEIGHSFSYLLTQSELIPKGSAGMAAISIAVGPALAASLRADIQTNARFLLAIGGYYDLPRILGYHATGHYQTPEITQQRVPNEYAKWVFVLSHLEQLKDPSDRNLLRTIASRKLENPQAPAADLITRLKAPGRQVYDFINNRDPAHTTSLMSQLPASIRSNISELNLANKDLTQIKGQTILVHGLDDEVIPAAESQALSKALPPGRTHLFLVNGLQHVDTNPTTLDIWHLWQAIDTLLAQRSS